MAKPVRLAVCSAIGLGLAAVTGAHALSSISTRTAPQLAISVFGSNGAAHERLAYSQFLAAAKAEAGGAGESETDKGTDVPSVRVSNSLAIATLPTLAKAQRSHVLAAIRYEPLSPRAHALAIMAETSSRKKGDWIAAASSLNRRDVILQGLALEHHAARGDYPAAIATIDQMLRVKPERSDTIFPLLTSALTFDDTVPVFARLLADPLPWRDAFLMHAAQDGKVRDNLARLRSQIDFDNENFDRSLIAGLVAQGEIPTAADLYSKLVSSSKSGSSHEWRADYPPFDWTFADDAAFRAQPSSDPSKLEFSIRPGRGGTVATRIVETPSTPFAIRLQNDISPAGQVEDVKLELRCASGSAPFFTQSFVPGNARFEVLGVPANCQYLKITINARAWSGLPALRGTISQMQISAVR
jgi:hypothetical protein